MFTDTVRPGRVTMDWGTDLPVFDCLLPTDDRHWNGWSLPTFTLEYVRAHRAEFARMLTGDADGIQQGMTWDESDMPHLFNIDGAETWDDADTFTAEGVEYVRLGYAAYTWIERD